MQIPTESQPAAAPIVAPPPPATITTVGPNGATQTLTVPRTASEVEQILQQREELSEQLISVASRRRELAQEMLSGPGGASRAGLEARLGVLDQRIIQLESDLAATGRQLSSAPAGLVASEQQGTPQGGDDFEEGVMAGGFSVLLASSLFFLYLRRRWKRRLPVRAAELQGESAQRLVRLEQGMEAIAIEIERVAEGQRFVTKLMSESETPLLARDSRRQ